MPEIRDPIFVGGTQRSGTHATAGLIGAHRAVAHLPREMKFHAHQLGLPGVIAGRTSPRAFAQRMRDFWWKRPYREGRTRGLYKTIPRERFDAALAEFLDASRATPLRHRLPRRPRPDLVGPSRDLVKALFDPIAVEDGAPRWVEMSPRNAQFAPDLLEMFPDMKLVYSIRDGRDVACSLVRLPFGPENVLAALARWSLHLRRADASVRRLPGDRVLAMRLEQLLLTRREERFAALLEFLELDEDEAIRATFEGELTPENGHLGRWRVELPAPERDELDRRYREVLEQMAIDGIASRPDPDPLPADFAAVPAGELGSAIDPWADGRAEHA
ncbi:MAG TPA: sulfotransferase [Solirubrobacterales bacterium]|nr:sulfotransferase [Solirubrobacterales bacterium]